MDLSDWKLTLPTGGPRKAIEVRQPALVTFHDAAYFAVSSAGDAVLFTAPASGVTTKGSDYPRSELREMQNGKEASWSAMTGVHVLELREAFTHLPVAKPEVVGAQIHDGTSDALELLLRGKRLFVRFESNKALALIDENYVLGTPFDFSLKVAKGIVSVTYNGVERLRYPASGTTYYFKAGCYTQSNTERGDKPDAFGQVAIYRLRLSHQP